MTIIILNILNIFEESQKQDLFDSVLARAFWTTIEMILAKLISIRTKFALNSFAVN